MHAVIIIASRSQPIRIGRAELGTRERWKQSGIGGKVLGEGIKGREAE